MIKNLSTIGIAVAIVLSIVAIVKSPSQVVVEKTIQAGAVSSPDIMSPYFSYGGVRHWAVKQQMFTASTTICSFDSPSEPTIMSLYSPSVWFDVSSTTASNVVIATSSSAFTTATTTLVAQKGIAANFAGLAVVSTTTTSSLVAERYVAANTHFNVSMSGGTGTFSPTGSCSATFRALQ